MTELELVKAKLGITSTARDQYLQTLIESVKSDWANHQGMILDYAQSDIMDLLADVVVYKYKNHEQPGMPRHLQFRLRSLWFKHAGGAV